MKSYIPLVVAAVLLVGGCGKKDDARPVASQPPVVKPEDSKATVIPTPATVIPTPPLPASDVSKGPQPGQAGDHSSPAFKAGGMPDKKK